MLNKPLLWIKSNKLTTLLILIVLWLIWSSGRSVMPGTQYPSFESSGLSKVSAPFGGMDIAMAPPSGRGVVAEMAMEDDYQSTANTNRMVVQSSNLSLLVKDVPASRDSVIAKAEELGGWMVNSSLNRPEESPFAHVTISVPSTQIKPALDYFRSLSIKVVSENLQGRDVTDSYTDLEEHISILEKTKSRYEDIRTKAVEVNDLITITRELTNIQTQIDRYKGQLQKLEQQVSMSQISVYISTDEIALPYAPDQAFRPGVIFKLAVRSLVSTFYGLGTKAIWIVVYSIIWIPVLFIIRWFQKRGNNQRIN